MELDIYQIDAFADEVFKGNPAAVVPLEKWLPNEILQAIALENNLAETAFFVPKPGDVKGHYDLRWFTPLAEVDLCGHATLASAYVLYEFLSEDTEVLTFDTRSGPLVVRQVEDDLLSIDLPARVSKKVSDDSSLADQFGSAIAQHIQEVQVVGEYVLCILETEAQVRAVSYAGAIEDTLRTTSYWGLIITAPVEAGGEYDFVSRFFAPTKGVPEDPVTGSAHCTLAPYWAERLGKSEMFAYQASPRGGAMHCRVDGARVKLSGRAVSFLKGTISIPDIG